uniref:Vesicle tethering protein Uso1/P115-like head domain-containing protein n=1 Tax=Oryza meridionalis TaxID=40149 RepID=A0A0E0FCX1_9ORYZ
MARIGGGRGRAARTTPRRSVDRLTVEFIDTNSSNHINRLISDHHGCRRVGRRAPRRRGRLSTSTPWRAGCRSEPSTSSPANAVTPSIAFRVGQQEGNDGLLPSLERFKRDAALSALRIRIAGGGAVVDAAGGGRDPMDSRSINLRGFAGNAGKNIMQGIGGFVFGNERSESKEDSYVERFLDRISSGTITDDRRSAMTELQSLVAESRSAQMSFGAMGFPVLLNVLKEDREDVELVRGALETFVSALTPIETSQGPKTEVQPASVNSDLLSRETENISLLLSLLSEEDFYVRYYTIQLLTALLTNSLKRCPEIQKIVVFEGVFEKIFSIIREEGYSDGGVVVQMLLKETIGFDPLIAILKIRRGSAFNFTQQKTVNLLGALDTVELLLMGGGSSGEPGKDANKTTNQTALAQKNILDHLLLLGVESQWAPVALRCMKNPGGQALLASKIAPHPNQAHATFGATTDMPFGSILLQALVSSDDNGDMEACCRASSVLSHIIKDNLQCKDRVLQIQLETPAPSLGRTEPLLHRIVTCLSIAASAEGENGQSGQPEESYIQPVILRLLIVWLVDCANAIDCLLESVVHLNYIIELASSKRYSACVRGLAAVVLGACVLYNASREKGRDAFAVADAISQKIGLSTYFLRFDELRKRFAHSSSGQQNRKQLSRSSANSMSDFQEIEEEEINKGDQHPVLSEIFDSHFFSFLSKLETDIRDNIMDIFSRTKTATAIIPAELEQKNGEVDGEYIKRLKSFVEKQCNDMQDLLGRNAMLAEELVRTGGGNSADSLQKPSSGRERVQIESLRQELEGATRRIEALKAEHTQIEAEASNQRNLAAKLESDLKSLSDAYNSLEQANFRLDSEVKALRQGGSAPYPDVEAIKAEAKEEAEKESEAELNDLLVCLGQEQSKVEKLSARLAELGEDVDTLLQGIGDDTALPDDDDDEDEDDE